MTPPCPACFATEARQSVLLALPKYGKRKPCRMNKIEVPPPDQAEDKRWWQLSVELKDHRRKLDRITTYLVIIAIMLGMLFVSHFWRS